MTVKGLKEKLKKTGELLAEAGLITQEQLENALEKKKGTKKKVGEILVELGFVSEENIAKVIALQLGIRFIDLSSVSVEPEVLQLVSEKLCREHTFIPISSDKRTVIAVFADPLDLEAIDDLRFGTSRSVIPAVSTPKQIKEAIERYYHINTPLQELVKNMSSFKQSFIEIIYDRDSDAEISELVKRSETAPIITMVNTVIGNAVRNRASDIHIEPHQNNLKLRERVDGLLRDAITFPKWVQALIISRIKIMAKMDISERRIPQDGRIKIRIQGREMDLRVSTLPTQYGENVVIRILDSKSGVFDLESIGFSNEHKELVKTMFKRPQGFVLVTGPTGSGKTSTLYGMLSHVKSEKIHIVSLEDPIEYELPGISQVGINEKVGLTFAFSLRAVLRQDPDVILVGEIRDSETAFIAMQASVTGHLVLSSLHTNSSVATITRLKNMGVPNYLISSSLNGVVAQRLLRLICPKCKIPYIPSPDEFISIGMRVDDTKGMRFYKGTGCENCGNSGYKGRIGIFEVLNINSQIRDLIASDASEDAITKAALSSGLNYIIHDGIKKVKQGLTTLEELNRMLVFEDEDMMGCPKCNTSIKSDFVNCPNCGYYVTSLCSSCGKPREQEWNYCPYCKAEYVTIHSVAV